MNEQARFWAKVDRGEPHECWNWLGSKNGKGYGLFRAHGAVVRAHRYVLSPGINLSGIAMHSCDNPSCVNPAHIMAGTHKLNIHDCIKKGRRAPAKGSSNNFARLTESQVIAIRSAWSELPKSSKGLTHDGAARNLAARYGIGYRNLKMIVNSETWRHV